MNFLTVVLLTYNHEKTLARTFDSILEQKTDFDFDIFVLEDCSIDKTADICREYKERYPEKIKLLLNEKNLGVTENFKQGLINVKSKYFAFLEGDDYWCNENKLQKQLVALEQNPDCVFCGHNTLVKDNVTKREQLYIDDAKRPLKTKYSMKDRFSVHPSSRVYRNIIDMTNLPSFLVLDSHFYILYMTKGNLYYINEVMSVYNVTGKGFWSGKTRKRQKLGVLNSRYKANKFFNFAYEYKYYPHSKLLKISKKILGVKSGWRLFYYLETLRIQLKFLFSTS